MNTLPFFTIITASLNGNSTIRRILESVKNQTFNDLEHIVIDGGSSDGTQEILNKYKNTYDLTWISESDNGIADAINKGLVRASGCYIVVIHADDYLLNENSLNNVYRLLIGEKFDIWSFPVIKEHHFHGRQLCNPIRILWWNHFKFIFLHQGAFVHRRVFDRIGNFNEQFSIAMDYDFFYRALKSRSTVKFGNQPVANMGGSGISSNPRMLENRLREESMVQRMNEKRLSWRMLQKLFQVFYFPYKTRLSPKLF